MQEKKTINGVFENWKPRSFEKNWPKKAMKPSLATSDKIFEFDWENCSRPSDQGPRYLNLFLC